MAAKSASEAAPVASPMPSLNAYAVDWASPSQQASSSWEQPQQQSMHSMSATHPIQITTVVDIRRLSSSSFGDVPTHMAEQVLDSPTHAGGCTLPTEIPGQVNFSPPQSFSFFGVAPAPAAAPANAQSGQSWTYNNAATSGLQLTQQSTAGSAGSSPNSKSASSTAQAPSFSPSTASVRSTPPSRSTGGPAKWGLDMRGTEHKSKQPQSTSRGNKGPVNEVVCGAMMLAYERAGKWEQVSCPIVWQQQHVIAAICNPCCAKQHCSNSGMYNNNVTILGQSSACINGQQQVLHAGNMLHTQCICVPVVLGDVDR